MSAVCTVLYVLHYMTNELSEEVGYLQVVLCCRHLLEVATVLLSQGSALLLTYLTSIAQVLLVSHQEYWKDPQSGIERVQYGYTTASEPGGEGA